MQLRILSDFNALTTAKSFNVVSVLLATILEFLALILFHNVGINQISSGPSALAFSILYQWYRLIPPAYHFRIFGMAASNKAFVYILASQVMPCFWSQSYY